MLSFYSTTSSKQHFYTVKQTLQCSAEVGAWPNLFTQKIHCDGTRLELFFTKEI